MGFSLDSLTESQRVDRQRRRFMRKVDVAPNGCWTWSGCLDPMGYGRFNEGGEHGAARLAHRISYELHVGAIPAGMTVDHTCHNVDMDCVGGAICGHRSCVNPAHLEVVTQRENVGRGRVSNHAPPTHCPQNHAYDEVNTYWSTTPNGSRTAVCRICTRASGARYRIRKAAERLQTYADNLAAA